MNSLWWELANVKLAKLYTDTKSAGRRRVMLGVRRILQAGRHPDHIHFGEIGTVWSRSAIWIYSKCDGWEDRRRDNETIGAILHRMSWVDDSAEFRSPKSTALYRSCLNFHDSLQERNPRFRNNRLIEVRDHGCCTVRSLASASSLINRTPEIR